MKHTTFSFLFKLSVIVYLALAVCFFIFFFFSPEGNTNVILAAFCSFIPSPQNLLYLVTPD